MNFSYLIQLSSQYVNFHTIVLIIYLFQQGNINMNCPNFKSGNIVRLSLLKTDN